MAAFLFVHILTDPDAKKRISCRVDRYLLVCYNVNESKNIHSHFQRIINMEDKKAIIFNCAKELFSSKGFKGTNVSDITKTAGIATGTFYNYYPSKDHLFMEIYLIENEQLKRSLMESVEVDPDDDPVKFIKEFLTMNFQGMSSNPILREWYNRELFSKLEKEFYKQRGFENFEFMNDALSDLIKKWKAEGKIRHDLGDELIFAIFNAMFYIDIHKRDIGIQHFPHIIDYIVEFVMEGLTERTKHNE